MILALDTASTTASVAIAEDSRILIALQLNTGKTHSEQLLPMIDAALSLIKRDRNEIQAITMTQGPGSFTGLRIGFASAKGLALALQVPLLPIPTLDVLAEGCSNWRGVVCPIMNARRQEVYTAIYFGNGNTIERKSDYQAISLQTLVNELGHEQPILFTGDGVDVYARDLLDAYGEDFYATKAAARYIQAEYLALLAEKSMMNHSPLSLEEIKPIYLRQSEAVIKWEAAHPGETLNV